MKQLFFIISFLLIFTSAAIGADNLSAVIEAVDIPPYVKPAKFNYKVLVKNLGKTSLQTISFKTCVGEVNYDRAVAISPTIKQGKSGWVEIKNVPNPGNGGFDLDVSIIKINNQVISEPENFSALLTTYSDGFRRRPIIECLMDNSDTEVYDALLHHLNINYPEYPIIHAEASSTAAYGLDEYSEILANRLDDNCCFIANRVTTLPGALDYDYGDESGLDSLTICNIRDFHEFVSSYPAYADIELRGRVRPDYQILDLNVLTEFSISSTSVHDFSLLLKNGSKPVYYHNYGSQFFGDYGVGEGSYQSFKLEVPIDMIDDDIFDAVALITNRRTGEIVNTRIIAANRNNAGVDGVSDDENSDCISWFTIDGRLLPGQPSMTGLYIRKSPHSTRKVKI